MQIAEISGLTIYPVKSMQGVELECAELTPQGLVNDRRLLHKTRF